MKTIVALAELEEFANKIVAFNLVNQIDPTIVSDFKINDLYFGVISSERIAIILNGGSYYTHVLDIYSSVENQKIFANIDLSFYPINLYMREANPNEIKDLIIASTQNRIILAPNDLAFNLTLPVAEHNIEVVIIATESCEMYNEIP